MSAGEGLSRVQVVAAALSARQWSAEARAEHEESQARADDGPSGEAEAATDLELAHGGDAWERLDRLVALILGPDDPS